MGTAVVKRIRDAASNGSGYEPPSANTLGELIDDFMNELTLILRDNRLTLQEFVMILLCGLKISIQFCDVLPVDNGRRRDIVMGTAYKLFDAYAFMACPTILKPFWLFISPSLRAITATAASSAIEFLLPVLRSSYA